MGGRIAAARGLRRGPENGGAPGRQSRRGELMYVDDNKETLSGRRNVRVPTNVPWTVMISPYIKSNPTYLCADDSAPDVWETGGLPTSYAWNCLAGGADVGLAIGQLTKPAYIHMFQDYERTCTKIRRDCGCGSCGLAAIQVRVRIGERHNARANIAFFDGHVASGSDYDVNPDWSGRQNDHYLYNP